MATTDTAVRWLHASVPKLMFIDSSIKERPRFLQGVSRNALIVGGVLLLHVLALWALNNGLLRRAVEVFIPVQILAEMVEPPRPVIPPPPPVPPPAVVPKRATVKPVAPTPLPPPVLQPVANAEPTPNAPTAVVAPPAPLPPITAPQAVVPVPSVPIAVAPPAPPRVELPSSDAEYLQNPKPPYPAISKRLNEQGTVLVNVFIGADGRAQKGDVKRSSGFDRLDQSALATVLKWRYVPGKRAGVPEAMWFTVPIEFVLN